MRLHRTPQNLRVTTPIGDVTGRKFNRPAREQIHSDISSSMDTQSITTIPYLPYLTYIHYKKWREITCLRHLPSGTATVFFFARRTNIPPGFYLYRITEAILSGTPASFLLSRNYQKKQRFLASS